LIVNVPHLYIAGRQDDVLRSDGIHHIRSGKTVRLQLLGIDID